MPREFTDFNVPFLSTGERLVQLEETVDLLKQMWGDAEEVSFDGKYVKAENVVCQPKPPRRIPILIGGAGERVTLKITAREADIWNNLAAFHPQLEHKIDVLNRHCEALDRDPSEITISQQCLVTITRTAEEAANMADRAQKIFGGHMGDPKGPLAITGTAEQCCEKIRKHIDLGCTMFVMEFFGKDTIEPAALFAEAVIPEFSA